MRLQFCSFVPFLIVCLIIPQKQSIPEVKGVIFRQQLRFLLVSKGHPHHPHLQKYESSSCIRYKKACYLGLLGGKKPVTNNWCSKTHERYSTHTPTEPFFTPCAPQIDHNYGISWRRLEGDQEKFQNPSYLCEICLFFFFGIESIE